MSTNTVPFHQRRLERSTTDKWLGGVLGGIAQTYDWNPTLVRVLFIASFVLPGPQLLIYLGVWIVMAMMGR
ncbi:PspC domain protein [Corynebacterium occultum]|uniref:PspC domain protein n=1 Tax=Corynebacterium occultum TaxID=2675219 RepID=A0A6B8VVC2_9CORY|nr:PspC domain-containing protein [Corynebacterium occultum]QGU07059.1 PspC domain protein [Corynebacterium occultum]